MKISYLTISQIIQINESVLIDKEISKFLYRGGIELILFSVKIVFNDLASKEMLISKACHIWYEIASNQYMLWGNKRTGSAATREFLKINGLELGLDKEQEKSISWQISMGKISPADLLKVIEPNVS